MKADIENQLAQAKQLYQQRVEQAGSAEATTPTRGATLARQSRSA